MAVVADLVNARTTADPNAPLASLLKKHEYVIEYEGQEYYVGEPGRKGGQERRPPRTAQATATGPGTASCYCSPWPRSSFRSKSRSYAW